MHHATGATTKRSIDFDAILFHRLAFCREGFAHGLEGNRGLFPIGKLAISMPMQALEQRSEIGDQWKDFGLAVGIDFEPREVVLDHVVQEMPVDALTSIQSFEVNRIEATPAKIGRACESRRCAARRTGSCTSAPGRRRRLGTRAISSTVVAARSASC